GQVAGVTYDSAAPLERRLAEVPIDLGKAQNLVGFLNQVRGAEVRIQGPGGPVAGRLMGAELQNKTAQGLSMQSVVATVLSVVGELQLVELESAGALRFTEPAFAADMFRYLDILSTRYQRDIRKLRIQSAGTGERQLYVSYTSESPIWKTTYRIVLDPDRKPLLQGWAIVDNTTPMDWTDVSLSLVAGAPVSFIQNLSQPVYGRRPVVPLPEGVQVQPQVHEGTIEIPEGRAAVSGSVRDSGGNPVGGAEVQAYDPQGRPVGSTRTNEAGEFRLELAPGTYDLAAGLPGFHARRYRGIELRPGRTAALDFVLQVGMVSEEMKVGADAAPAAVRGGRMLMATEAAPPARPEDEALAKVEELRRDQAPPVAQARALGEQFEYRLPQPVTLRRNESGLLPILHAAVDGEKVSLYNAGSSESRPRLAVWLKNTSGLTLDAGAFTVIDTNAFAGEGLIETVQPGESRLLSYALDLGLEVSSNTQSERQRVERVEINRGVLRMHSKLTEKKSYVVRNNDQKVRRLVMEHPVRPGWRLVDTPAPAESSANFHRFRLEAKPKTTTEFVVREETPQETTYGITNISSEQITLWLKERSIDPEMEKALSAIVAAKTELMGLIQQIAALDKEQNDIFRDQERVRSNLQRLGGSAEEASLRQRYIRQLEQQENRLAALRSERDKLENARSAAQKQLDEMLQNLSLDRKL
ncbi:MAG: carboxypeptidase regulatory-like domain-containing protein, partial [Acidobacteriota bacterium]